MRENEGGGAAIVILVGKDKPIASPMISTFDILQPLKPYALG